MALNAPFHLQRGYFRNKRHLIDAAVARRAADAFGDVDRMIEINVVRKIVNARPVNRNTGLPTVSDRRQVTRGIKELRVAVHTRFRRRHTGRGAALDGRMAIPAVDSIVTDMVLVAELHRLQLDEVRLIPVG